MQPERVRDAASRRCLPIAALLLSGDQAANCCLKLQIRGDHWQVCLLLHYCECNKAVAVPSAERELSAS